MAGLFLPGTVGAAVMALAIGCAAVPPTGWTDAAAASLWALAAAAGAKMGGTFGAALGAVAVGATLARGVSGAARASAVALGTVGALAAALVARAFVLTGVLEPLPSGLAALATGATGGLIVGVSSLGRHLVRVRPSVEASLRAMDDQSELGRLLGRAAAAYRDAIAAIGDEVPAARAAADEMVRKMTRFGRRWRDLELEAARSAPEDLRSRLLLVGRRLDATADPLARADLARAREALMAQLGYLEEIAGGRERAVARLEHQVATLERLRLAALRHRSADAARMGVELQPLVDELTQAGGDLDIAAEALTEATAASSAGALPPRS